MTRQVTDQLYIDLDYFTPEEYYVYTAEAVAACSSQASITCDATKIAGGAVQEASGNLNLVSTLTSTGTAIRGAASSMTAVATTTATISHIHGADLVAFSNGQLSAQASVIRDGNIVAATQFSVAITAVRGIYVQAQADSLASLTSVGSRTRALEAAHSAAFSISATADIIKTSTAALTSQFSLSTTAIKTVTTTIGLSSISTLIAQGGQGVYAQGNFSAYTSLLASRNIARGRPVELTATNTSFNSTTKKYGSHSLSLNNTSSQIIFTNDNFEMEIPANTDFLIEFWINPNGGNVSGSDNLLLGVGDMTSLASMNANDSWALGITNLGRLDFKYATASNTFNTISTSNGILNGSTNWFHFVITRYNGVIFLVNNYTGGSNGASSTYTGAIYQGSYKKLKFRNPFSTSLLLDDFNFKIGFGDDGGEGENISAQAVNDPDKSVFLYHFNNNLVDDTAATFNQSAALASISSVTATISGTQRTSAAIVSQSTLVAQATKTSEINLVAFSNATVSIVINRVRSNDVTLVSQFTQVSSVDKIVNVISTQSSQFTQVSTAVKTVAPAISTNAIFSELVAIAKTGQGFIQADVVATMSTVAVKTTNITLAAVSAFTSTASAVKTTNATANLSSITSLTIDNARTRNFNSSLENSTQLTANINEIVQIAADLTAVMSLLAETGGIKQFFASFSSQTTTSSTILRIRDSSSSLASNFSQTASTATSRLAGGHAVLSAEATLAVTAGTVKTATVATDAIFSELAAVAKTGQGFITLDSVATQTAQAVKTSRAISSPSSQTSLVANAGTRFEASAALVNTAALTASGTFVTLANVHVNVASTLVCDPVKTVDAISLEASAGTMSTTAQAIRRANISLSALAFELAVGTRNQTFSASLTSQSTMTARTGGTFGVQSLMQGFASELIVADIIHIDARLTWMITDENRTSFIQSDSRTYSIQEDRREYMIIEEDRSYLITRELLDTNLQGV